MTFYMNNKGIHNRSQFLFTLLIDSKPIVLDYGLKGVTLIFFNAIVSNYTVFLLTMIHQHGVFYFIL